MTLENLNSYNRKMLSGISGLDKSTEISINISNWVDDRFSVNSGFAEMANRFYGASTGYFPVNTLYTDTQNPVNKWLTAALGHPTVLNAGVKKPEAVSASVLKFRTHLCFDMSKEKEMVFTNYDGSEKKVSAFYHEVKHQYRYHAKYNDKADILNLNSIGGAYILMICIPDTDMNEFISEFAADIKKMIDLKKIL